MQFLITVIDCLAISFFLYLLANLRDRKRRGGLPYPPGPPSWPIIGNLLDVPNATPWSAYADMSKKYGGHNFFEDAGLHQLKLAFKAISFVFAFILRSSSYCARIQP